MRKRVSIKKRMVETRNSGDEPEGWIIKNVVFGGTESVFLDPVFRGGDIDVVFGGIVIDLRNTTLPETTVYLDLTPYLEV